MAHLVLVLVLLVLAGAGSWSWIRSAARPAAEPVRHLWAQSRASSADGALVRLEAEVFFEVDDHTSTSAGEHLALAAEDALRRTIVSTPVLALPGVGDEVPLDLGEQAESLGVRPERLVVTAADVEITRELRRLVGGP